MKKNKKINYKLIILILFRIKSSIGRFVIEANSAFSLLIIYNIYI